VEFREDFLVPWLIISEVFTSRDEGFSVNIQEVENLSVFKFTIIRNSLFVSWLDEQDLWGLSDSILTEDVFLFFADNTKEDFFLKQNL